MAFPFLVLESIPIALQSTKGLGPFITTRQTAEVACDFEQILNWQSSLFQRPLQFIHQI